jgi:hypothetical protein
MRLVPFTKENIMWVDCSNRWIRLFSIVSAASVFAACAETELDQPSSEDNLAEEDGDAEEDGSTAEYDTEGQAWVGEKENSLLGCDLYAKRPTFESGHIHASGGWSGCPSFISISVYLRHDKKWQFDETLAVKSGTGASNSIDLSYACGSNSKSINVYTETRVFGVWGGWKTQSKRTTVPCGK